MLSAKKGAILYGEKREWCLKNNMEQILVCVMKKPHLNVWLIKIWITLTSNTD